ERAKGETSRRPRRRRGGSDPNRDRERHPPPPVFRDRPRDAWLRAAETQRRRRTHAPRLDRRDRQTGEKHGVAPPESQRGRCARGLSVVVTAGVDETVTFFTHSPFSS